MKKQKILLRCGRILNAMTRTHEDIYRDLFELLAIKEEEFDEKDIQAFEDVGQRLYPYFDENEDEESAVDYDEHAYRATEQGNIELELRQLIVDMPQFIDLDLLQESCADDMRRIAFFGQEAVLRTLEDVLSPEAFVGIEGTLYKWTRMKD